MLLKLTLKGQQYQLVLTVIKSQGQKKLSRCSSEIPEYSITLQDPFNICMHDILLSLACTATQHSYNWNRHIPDATNKGPIIVNDLFEGILLSLN